MNLYNVFVLRDCGVQTASMTLVYHETIDGHFIDENHTAFLSEDGKCIIEVVGKTAPEGYSDLRSAYYEFGHTPDGKGGWKSPEPSPIPDAKSALNWKLLAVLASKGITFAPTDPVVEARWQYEPILAIDGVVAQALATSLGYDEAQLQALFNEAAAVK